MAAALSARALRLPAPSAVARRCLASATSPVCLTWGEGTEGQLGHTPFALSGVLQQYAELAPRQLEGFVLRDVACGTNHTLAVDGDGAVWSWGKSDFGKCGHGDDADCKAPARVAARAGKG
jgi:alpha-tubulin suppressor-like RCC1 family protein